MIENEKKERKYGFSRDQKGWLIRAWTDYFGSLFCIFPVYHEDHIDVYLDCRVFPIEWHHCVPQRYSREVLHEDPNRPDNATPICPEHHRKGQKNKPITREDQECIHVDTIWANANYRGKVKPTSYDKVFQQRERLVSEGVKYWNDRWDNYLLEMSEMVAQDYLIRFPDDSWPEI